MNRRNALRVIGTGAVGMAAVTAFKCDGPRLDAEISIAQTAINALNIIVPSVAPLTSKILKLLKDVDADAKNGDFSSAQAAFDSLSVFITQLQDDAGITINDRAKLILVTVLGAIRAIGLAVKSSMPVATRVAMNPATVKTLDAMTSPQAVDALFKAAKMEF